MIEMRNQGQTERKVLEYEGLLATFIILLQPTMIMIT
jgi:hypothetical protein